ncbi:hypothetical protein DL96DRAFT_1628758 [Flagelloscypha sp. PMI_526]|nr:hypothetical protein DL96DRAFT_1628758 [Flagelloscypha sp. PMI_526]
MFNPLFLILLVSGFLNLVLGSLYPTSPVSDTVFYAGQPANISWMNDRHNPPLKDLGNVRIELWAGKNNISVLGEDIDPQAFSYFPTMPNLTYLGEQRIYGIHFVPHNKQYETIYTARFSIQEPPPSMKSTSNSSKDHAYLTVVLPSTTYVSTLDRQTAPSASSTLVVDAIHTQSLKDSPSFQSSSNDGGGQKPFHVNAAVGPRFDVEKMKFRLVFMMWPVFFGVSMAL